MLVNNILGCSFDANQKYNFFNEKNSTSINGLYRTF